MRRPLICALLALLGTEGCVRQASAQSFEVLGTRAAGMGGAFVGVADDASAVYWNPAGLVLGGSYFSMLLDNTQGQAEPDDIAQAGSQSATIIALTTLPFGVSYYRLSATSLRPTGLRPTGLRPTGLRPTDDPQSVRLERLTTHHAGVTFVQSLTERIAVASTLKWVRGLAASGAVPLGDRDDLDDLLDLHGGSGELPDASTSKFDADIGVMALFGVVRAGLTVRNVTEPDFSTVGGGALQLKRQTRAGMSYVGVPRLIVAADVDLERVGGSLGDIRDVAAGAEAQLLKRLSLRSGFRFNTLGSEPGGHAPVYSLGGSVATFRSLLVDAQVTLGSRSGDRGWGVAARLVY